LVGSRWAIAAGDENGGAAQQAECELAHKRSSCINVDSAALQ
jgi:hypothetical protein